MKNQKNKGYMTLTNVITVGAMALTVAISLLIVGMNSYENTYITEESVILDSLIYSCGEIALNQIKLNNSYAGNETYTIGERTCRIEDVISNPDGTVSINIYANVNEVVKRSQIVIDQLAPVIQIDSWSDVASF